MFIVDIDWFQREITSLLCSYLVNVGTSGLGMPPPALSATAS